MEFFEGKMLVDRFYRGAIITILGRQFALSEDVYKRMYKRLFEPNPNIESIMNMILSAGTNPELK